jgi:predicted transcriptional regulator
LSSGSGSGATSLNSIDAQNVIKRNYMIRREGSVTKLQVLDAISDNISVKMFRMIAADSETSDGLMDKLGVSRKQYYDRMRKLYAAGLITGRGREYALTSFGRLIYRAQMDLVKASDHRLKLKAIDMIKAYKNISKDEYSKLVDTIIDDTELKNIIINIT